MRPELLDQYVSRQRGGHLVREVADETARLTRLEAYERGAVPLYNQAPEKTNVPGNADHRFLTRSWTNRKPISYYSPIWLSPSGRSLTYFCSLSIKSV